MSSIKYVVLFFSIFQPQLYYQRTFTSACDIVITICWKYNLNGIPTKGYPAFMCIIGTYITIEKAGHIC